MSTSTRVFPFAVISNVVDGDTCDATVDLGFTVKVAVRFRLAGINTPERGKPGAQQATDYLRQYLGQPVHLTVTKTDKYGRWLAGIEHNGVDVNKALLEQGLAVPYDGS